MASGLPALSALLFPGPRPLLGLRSRLKTPGHGLPRAASLPRLPPACDETPSAPQRSLYGGVGVVHDDAKVLQGHVGVLLHHRQAGALARPQGLVLAPEVRDLCLQGARERERAFVAAHKSV